MPFTSWPGCRFRSQLAEASRSRLRSGEWERREEKDEDLNRICSAQLCVTLRLCGGELGVLSGRPIPIETLKL